MKKKTMDVPDNVMSEITFSENGSAYFSTSKMVYKFESGILEPILEYGENQAPLYRSDMDYSYSPTSYLRAVAVWKEYCVVGVRGAVSTQPRGAGIICLKNGVIEWMINNPNASGDIVAISESGTIFWIYSLGKETYVEGVTIYGQTLWKEAIGGADAHIIPHTLRNSILVAILEDRKGCHSTFVQIFDNGEKKSICTVNPANHGFPNGYIGYRISIQHNKVGVFISVGRNLNCGFYYMDYQESGTVENCRLINLCSSVPVDGRTILLMAFLGLNENYYFVNKVIIFDERPGMVLSIERASITEKSLNTDAVILFDKDFTLEGLAPIVTPSGVVAILLGPLKKIGFWINNKWEFKTAKGAFYLTQHQELIFCARNCNGHIIIDCYDLSQNTKQIASKNADLHTKRKRKGFER